VILSEKIWSPCCLAEFPVSCPCFLWGNALPQPGSVRVQAENEAQRKVVHSVLLGLLKQDASLCLKLTVMNPLSVPVLVVKSFLAQSPQTFFVIFSTVCNINILWIP